MSLDGRKLGTITRTTNCVEARIERFFEHDQEAVWKMLTDPIAPVARIVEQRRFSEAQFSRKWDECGKRSHGRGSPSVDRIFVERPR